MKGFESSLERDFFILLDFDLNVDRYEEQPVRIEYKDGDGRARTYTPDVLVYYRDDMTPAKWMKPLLCEVKEAVRETRKARRSRQRRAMHQQVVPPKTAEEYTPFGGDGGPAVESIPVITPFDEMEELD